LCVFSEESPDRKQLIFLAFEPSKEPGRQELARVNLKPPIQYYVWDLSSDGMRVAFNQNKEGESRIQILPLAGGAAQEVNVKYGNGIRQLFWAPDGKGLVVSEWSSGEISYVDLKGTPYVLEKEGFIGGVEMRYGAPSSPDGRHLALMGTTKESNVWLLENF
jgi:dipeptidyl aminopeptidase/acylaminoacyl peptidase